MFKCSFCVHSSPDLCPFSLNSGMKKEECEKAIALMIKTLKNTGRG